MATWRQHLLASVLVIAAACIALPASAQTTAPASQPATDQADASAKVWFRRIPSGTFRPDASIRPKLPERVDRAFVIPITGALEQESMLDSLRRKIAQCKAHGVQLVVFEIDSPGGRSDIMDDIVKLIHDDLRSVYTVAYVKWAMSAAGIVSLACDEIVLRPGSRFGDAMPILLGPSGITDMSPEIRGKMESAFRADVRAMAERHHYNVALVEAMVSRTDVVLLVRDLATGRLEVVSARAVAGEVADLPLGESGMPATQPAAGKAKYVYVATIDGPEEVLTLTAREAMRLGFGDFQADSMDAIREHFHVHAPMTMLEDSFSERVVGFLTSQAVTAILLMVGGFCLYTEIRTPGFGIFGIIAIACFAVLFGARYITGFAAWWEICLFVVGLVLLLIEVFVTPTFGALGVVGIVCCLVSLAAMVIPNAPDALPIPRTNMDWGFLEDGTFAIATGFVLSMIAAALLTRYMPKLPIANRLVLAPAAAGGPISEDSPLARISGGEVGTVEQICRPVGKARFENELFDVLTEGGVAEPGTRVRVIRRKGNVLLVEPINQAEQSPAGENK